MDGEMLEKETMAFWPRIVNNNELYEFGDKHLREHHM
jgi:hypothetical protein